MPSFLASMREHCRWRASVEGGIIDQMLSDPSLILRFEVLQFHAPVKACSLHPWFQLTMIAIALNLFLGACFFTVSTSTYGKANFKNMQLITSLSRGPEVIGVSLGAEVITGEISLLSSGCPVLVRNFSAVRTQRHVDFSAVLYLPSPPQADGFSIRLTFSNTSAMVISFELCGKDDNMDAWKFFAKSADVIHSPLGVQFNTDSELSPAALLKRPAVYDFRAPWPLFLEGMVHPVVLSILCVAAAVNGRARRAAAAQKSMAAAGVLLSVNAAVALVAYSLLGMASEAGRAGLTVGVCGVLGIAIALFERGAHWVFMVAATASVVLQLVAVCERGACGAVSDDPPTVSLGMGLVGLVFSVARAYLRSNAAAAVAADLAAREACWRAAWAAGPEGPVGGRPALEHLAAAARHFARFAAAAASPPSPAGSAVGGWAGPSGSVGSGARGKESLFGARPLRQLRRARRARRMSASSSMWGSSVRTNSSHGRAWFAWAAASHDDTSAHLAADEAVGAGEAWAPQDGGSSSGCGDSDGMDTFEMTVAGSADPRRPVMSLDQLYAQALAAAPLLSARCVEWANTSGGRVDAGMIQPPAPTMGRRNGTDNEGGISAWWWYGGSGVGGVGGGGAAEKAPPGTAAAQAAAAAALEAVLPLALRKWIRARWIKHPWRAADKALTCYGGDVSRVLDIVRGRICFEQADDLAACLALICSGDSSVKVLRVRNTLHPWHDHRSTAGFRGVFLAVRIDSPEARTLCCENHICELQLLLRPLDPLLNDSTAHIRYLRFRVVRPFLRHRHLPWSHSVQGGLGTGSIADTSERGDASAAALAWNRNIPAAPEAVEATGALTVAATNRRRVSFHSAPSQLFPHNRASSSQLEQPSRGSAVQEEAAEVVFMLQEDEKTQNPSDHPASSPAAGSLDSDLQTPLPPAPPLPTEVLPASESVGSVVPCAELVFGRSFDDLTTSRDTSLQISQNPLLLSLSQHRVPQLPRLLRESVRGFRRRANSRRLSHTELEEWRRWGANESLAVDLATAEPADRMALEILQRSALNPGGLLRTLSARVEKAMRTSDFAAIWFSSKPLAAASSHRVFQLTYLAVALFFLYRGWVSILLIQQGGTFTGSAARFRILEARGGATAVPNIAGFGLLSSDGCDLLAVRSYILPSKGDLNVTAPTPGMETKVEGLAAWVDMERAVRVGGYYFVTDSGSLPEADPVRWVVEALLHDHPAESGGNAFDTDVVLSSSSGSVAGEDWKLVGAGAWELWRNLGSGMHIFPNLAYPTPAEPRGQRVIIDLRASWPAGIELGLGTAEWAAALAGGVVAGAIGKESATSWMWAIAAGLDTAGSAVCAVGYHLLQAHRDALRTWILLIPTLLLFLGIVHFEKKMIQVLLLFSIMSCVLNITVSISLYQFDWTAACWRLLLSASFVVLGGVSIIFLARARAFRRARALVRGDRARYDAAWTAVRATACTGLPFVTVPTEVTPNSNKNSVIAAFLSSRNGEALDTESILTFSIQGQNTTGVAEDGRAAEGSNQPCPDLVSTPNSSFGLRSAGQQSNIIQPFSLGDERFPSSGLHSRGVATNAEAHRSTMRRISNVSHTSLAADVQAEVIDTVEIGNSKSWLDDLATLSAEVASRCPRTPPQQIVPNLSPLLSDAAAAAAAAIRASEERPAPAFPFQTENEGNVGRWARAAEFVRTRMGVGSTTSIASMDQLSWRSRSIGATLGISSASASAGFHGSFRGSFGQVVAAGRPIRSLDQLFVQALCLHPILLCKIKDWASLSHGTFPAYPVTANSADDIANDDFTRPMLARTESSAVWTGRGLRVSDSGRQYLTLEEALSAHPPMRPRFAAVKSATRAIEKAVRSYDEDASHLVDLCRQSIVFRDGRDLLVCLAIIAADPDTAIVRIKNRMEANPKLQKSCLCCYDGGGGGYRDVLVNLRLETEEAAALGVSGHVCEVQLLLERFAEIKTEDGHSRYVAFRNLRGE